jgi:hypothetical protein
VETAEVKQSKAGLEIFVPESDRQPIVTIIALEVQGDVMQLPAIDGARHKWMPASLHKPGGDGC